MDRNLEENKQEKDFEQVSAYVELQKSRKGKWKYALGGVAIAALSFLGGFGARWYTLDKDMRTLINVKNKIDKEYYKDITDEEFYTPIFRVINNEILDDYSRYIRPEDYIAKEEREQGKRKGLGLVFYGSVYAQEWQLVVNRVSGNSPAEKAGFLAGDKVTGFGVSQEEMAECTSFQQFSEFLYQTADNTPLYVRVQRGTEEIVLSVTRANYVESYVLYKSSTTSYTVVGDDDDEILSVGKPLSVLDNETAYIRLIQFTGKADALFERALDIFKAEGKKNLVLDLRGNGGGDVDILQEISSYFCKDAKGNHPVISIADYGEYKEHIKAEDNDYYEYFTKDSRVCIVADRGTASASEALLGAMLDYGTIAYEDICLIEEDGAAKTYGKGIMQTTYVMDWIEQDALCLTTAQLLWPKTGACIHDRGILASDGTRSVQKQQNTDEELASAIQALFS